MAGKGDKWRKTDWKKFFNSEYWDSPKTETSDSNNPFVKEIKKRKGKTIITYK